MGRPISLYDILTPENEKEKYYRSEGWKRKCAARLEIDGYKCVACGCSTLSKLQIHHRGGEYSNFGNEDVLHDLITLCDDCHSSQPSSKKSYLVEQGIYHFKVIDFKVTDYEGSDKVPKCVQVSLSLQILDDDGRNLRKLFCDLKLVDFLRWKIEHFFNSIGLKMDKPLNELFDESIGKFGMCSIVQYETLNGNINNRIDDFMEENK